MNRANRIDALAQRAMRLIEATPFADDSPAHGRSGVALLYFYAGRHWNDDSLAERGLSLLEHAIGNIGGEEKESIKTPDFFTGLTGLLSILANLRQNGLLETSAEDFEALEEQCFQWASAQLEENNIDFFYGATGYLHYLSGLQPNALTDEYTTALTDRLLSRFSEERSIYGIVNHTYNRMDGRSQGEINYSMAHGMAAVLLVLTKLRDRGHRLTEIDEAISRGIDSMLYLSRKQASAPCCFVGAINIDTNQIAYQKKLGWCYSDLNVLHLLYRAGKALGRQDWIDAANTAAPVVSGRQSEANTLVTDPFLCHGSAGLFQYYHYLSNLGSPQYFRPAADYWLQRTVDDMEILSDDHFRSPLFTKTGHIHSLFYGLTGLALCLLTSLDDKNSSWASTIIL